MSSSPLLTYLLVITLHSHSFHMIQMAPLADTGARSAANWTNNLVRPAHDDALLIESTTAATMPTLTDATTPVASETTAHPTAASSAQPSPPTSAPVESDSLRARFRLKQIVPVDLYNPCSMEDENWSESYLHGVASGHDKVLDEKYSFDAELSDLDVMPDAMLNGDNLSHNSEEEERQLKVTLTQLVGKARFGYDLMKEMIEKASHLQGLVTDMIRKHLIQECQHLELPDIMEIPKHHSAPNLVTSLSGIYQTLANQTAHLYLIWTQQRKQSSRRNGCTQHGQSIQLLGSSAKADPASSTRPAVNKRLHARRVADDFLIVSSNLRGLMCHFKQAFHLFEIAVPTRQIVQQVLSHTFTGSIACSRMSVIDCQLMKSSVRIFGDIEQFLRLNSDKFFGSHIAERPPRP